MTNQLINVTNQNGELLVSARDLHKGLNVSERFSSWFNRMLQYGFDENVDYVGCKVFNTLANQELQDYALRLDMAKEICMVQRSELGKQFRRYFIECEKQLMAHALPTPEVPQINYDKYNNYNFKQYLQAIKVKDVPEETTNFIQAHESDTPDKRLAAYKIAKNALEEIKITLTESWQILMIQATLDDLNKKIELQKTYINRTRLAQQTKRIKKLQEEIRHYELDSFDNYQQFNLHPYTINTAYRAIDNKIECSKSYKQWKTNAAKELENLPTLEELGVNPNEYMKIDIWFYMRDESFDVDNQIKSFIDALKKHYDFDDKMIADVHARKYLTYSETFDNGCVYFALKNLDPIEIQTLTDGEL